YSISDVMNQLRNEQGTAENIKSKSVRKNVVSALERILRQLQLYRQTPTHGLAIFSGNTSEREGAADIQIWVIEPPDALKTKLYWCSQRFELEPLREMISEKEIYGIICMDKGEADIALVIGKKIHNMFHDDSIVPGKTRAGGQSAMRFSRVRAGMLNDWFKQVADHANKIFGDRPDVIGIIISGSGPTKEDFLKEEHLHATVRKKILGTVNTSYMGDTGLEETLVRGEELIKESGLAKEKTLLKDFFTGLQKPDGLVVYGLNETINAMKNGTLDTLILSETAPYVEQDVECTCGKKEEYVPKDIGSKTCEKCGHIKAKVAERDISDALEELAKQFGTKMILVSADTREGEQFLSLGGIGGFLRYRIG
ncbi:MAG: peptide chain release factor aRF-1, partial [Candidatus Aenigmatarchaeota archaeon]